MMSAIRVRNLTRRFGDFVAVNKVSFEVNAGEIFCYLGANGAGKSTTIRMLCGLLPPSSGRATVAGVDVAHAPTLVKSAIGYMSQKFSLYAELTVAENLDFFGGIYGLSPARRRAREKELLPELGLAEHRQRRTGDLPGGWRQRAALACALLHEPRILFLDEPTAGVDPAARRGFWDLIRSLSAQGTTVFVTTHHLDEAEYCNRVGFMVAGELKALDTPEALKRTHVPGVLFEVEGAGADLLRALPGVRSIEPFGVAFHLSADAASAPRLRGTLADLPGVQAREIEPTLEDVFLAVVQS
jgi:ABC-2 type transport system ATP-binding protein